jgi:DNA repair protein RecO (recombination protein O)
MTEKQGRFIILRKIKFSESDLIIHALSSTGSKKSFMARSALKSKKRFGGGVLEPLHYVNLTYKNSAKENGLSQLTEANLIDDFKKIKDGYDKLDLALYVVRCAAHVSQEEDVNSEFLFNLVGHTLNKIAATAADKHLDRLKLHFNLKFLFQQGVIDIDPWMNPFLKENISDSNLIDENPKLIEILETYSDSIDSLVEHYLKSADTT